MIPSLGGNPESHHQREKTKKTAIQQQQENFMIQTQT